MVSLWGKIKVSLIITEVRTWLDPAYFSQQVEGRALLAAKLLLQHTIGNVSSAIMYTYTQKSYVTQDTCGMCHLMPQWHLPGCREEEALCTASKHLILIQIHFTAKWWSNLFPTKIFLGGVRKFYLRVENKEKIILLPLGSFIWATNEWFAPSLSSADKLFRHAFLKILILHNHRAIFRKYSFTCNFLCLHAKVLGNTILNMLSSEDSNFIIQFVSCYFA